MIKHIIIWSFKEEMTAEEKAFASSKIKTELEALRGKIDGLIDIKVEVEHLASSTGDLLLDSSFESEEALKGYQENPEHLKAANYVRSVVGIRRSFDYEV